MLHAVKQHQASAELKLLPVQCFPWSLQEELAENFPYSPVPVVALGPAPSVYSHREMPSPTESVTPMHRVSIAKACILYVPLHSSKT